MLSRVRRLPFGPAGRAAHGTLHTMYVVIGADHAGFPAKQAVFDHLVAAGHRVEDVGAMSDDPVDFPDVALQVCRHVLDQDAERGLLICGTGIGASMAANKVNGIRAALAHDVYSAHQCVEHDNANVLCLGAQIVGGALMRELIDTFLRAKWEPVEPFTSRVAKLEALEERWR
jgi:ribose 5-phosphate isomerase B